MKEGNEGRKEARKETRKEGRKDEPRFPASARLGLALNKGR